MAQVKICTTSDVKKIYIEHLNKVKVREANCVLIERRYKEMVREHEYLIEEIAYLRNELEEVRHDLTIAYHEIPLWALKIITED